MSAYTDYPDVKLREGIRYQLQQPLVWHIGKEDGPAYIVPRLFVFDVSVPTPLRSVFSPHAQEYFKAAALHDSMLEAGWDRVTAASQFHQALKADGVSTWRRLVMLLAVILYKFN